MKVLRQGIPSSVFMAATQTPGFATPQKTGCLAPAAAERHAAQLHGAAGAAVLQEADCTLNGLYEVVKSTQQQQLQEGLTQQQVQHICHIIENIKLEDLGLDPSLGQAMTYGSTGSARELRARLRPKGSRGTVTYLDIHDDAAMTIGIFQLPPGARMPLHDHPGMTVFSRLLYGTLHVRAYDWVGPSSHDGCSMDSSSGGSPTHSSSSSGGGSDSHGSSVTGEFGRGGCGVQPARLVTDRVLSAPADTMVLFPSSGGNIHAFTAISPCAILDVLTPPYGSRNCTYYREVFPPQWVDAQGLPVLVPSDEVASWVAWQSAGAAAAAQPQLQQGQQQQQQPQQQPQQSLRDLQQQQQQQHEPQRQPHADTDMAGSSGSSGGGGGDGAETLLRYPSATGVGADGRPDIIVGLEVWKEPADFHVARGTYTGQRVT